MAKLLARSFLTLLAGGMLLATSANAAVLLSTSFSKNFPFGPFLPNESFEVVATFTNISSDQSITVCEGVCIGDEFTYSLGAWTSLPYGYNFYFGNISPDGPSSLPFDGQVDGILLPGQSIDFVYGGFSPQGTAEPGFYDFVNRVQIFAATVERPLLTTAYFSGRWEVVNCSEFPGGGNTGGCFPGPGPFPAPEPSTLALLGLGIAGLAFSRRRKQVGSRSSIRGRPRTQNRH